ncbi:MAG: hypothetical protein QMC38_06285, partial [Sinobacterium sp.]
MNILNSINAAMPEELLIQCSQFAPIKEYSDGYTIHNRGDLKSGLSIVYCGQVKLGNYGMDGKYQQTATLS